MCGVFETQGVDPKLAWAYGFCIPTQQCLSVARYADVGCYFNGQRVGP
jgi:hypothetical protein